MTSHRPTPPSGSGGRAYKARPASELMSAALRSLGMPSVKVTEKLAVAWGEACEESWRDHTSLCRLEGGVLEIGVTSDALRDELTNFHRTRLLAVLRAALPDVPLIGIRFLTDGEARQTADGERTE